VTKMCVRLPRRAKSDKLIVTRVIDAAIEAGLGGDPLAIINLYVSLKSKPMAILTGPARSGKVALLRAFGKVLTGANHWRFQEMVGHPWWASQCPGAGLLAEAQTLFSTETGLVGGFEIVGRPARPTRQLRGGLVAHTRRMSGLDRQACQGLGNARDGLDRVGKDATDGIDILAFDDG